MRFIAIITVLLLCSSCAVIEIKKPFPVQCTGYELTNFIESVHSPPTHRAVKTKTQVATSKANVNVAPKSAKTAHYRDVYGRAV